MRLRELTKLPTFRYTIQALAVQAICFVRTPQLLIALRALCALFKHLRRHNQHHSDAA